MNVLSEPNEPVRKVEAIPSPLPKPPNPVALIPVPLPIPARQRGQFERMVAGLLESQYNIRVSQEMLQRLVENTKVALPSRDDVEKAIRTSSPLYAAIKVSVDPISLP